MVFTPLNIPIFAGQGTASANHLATRNQALKDASSSAGSVLLSACHDIFHAELASLSSDDLERIDIDKADFLNREALLDVLTERYLYNALISGTSLCLIQSLRYLAIVETFAVTNNSLNPFVDSLKCDAGHNVGILGFSSGILPACIAGTSSSTIAYLSHAVEAYRLAFWIGLRVQQFRVTNLNPSGDAAIPWSLMLMGLNKHDAKKLIDNFLVADAAPSFLNISAVVDDQSVTISGHPDTLAAFSLTIPSGVTVHRPTLGTLYHSPVHVGGARSQVLADIKRRKIRFPDFQDIKFPIRSSFTGRLIDAKIQSGSLVESVVDMILTQPVNWDIVADELTKAIPSETPARFLNVGPGAGLFRSMERSISKAFVSFVDLSLENGDSQEGDFVAKQAPIAIVGMAVNMPGAPNTAALWKVLEQGINTISDIPRHRFQVSDYTNPTNPETSRRMKAHTGNFIDNVDEFDHEFFSISPREAKSMDPQQRILLHTAYEALENSGYVPNSTPTFQQDTFGCYIGAATHDYVQNLRDNIDVYYSPGTLSSFLSGRISYAMQFGGPSIVVDTACSSSIVAIYQACRALMNNDCSAALAGGVNVITSPDMYLGLDRGHFLSPTRQCKSFDASADGYSRGEGCGIFVLKRLSDAIAENDHIMGIIRGIEVNQSGAARSITHPHGPTQAALFQSVLKTSGVNANRVNVVEAHGTGTRAGDPTEMESIRSVFSTQRTSANPLHVTSIKANIGHLEAASGSAGLAKLLLMLQHHAIPRQISLKILNPKIAPLSQDHTILDTVLGPWNRAFEGQPRVALLNNFGAAGSNGALLLEEYLPADRPGQGSLYCMFGLSAKSLASLEELRDRYVSWLQDPISRAVRLEDIAYTATARRQIFPYRLAVSAGNKEELVRVLRTVPVIRSQNVLRKVIFVFSGQGGQYLGMGKSLYHSSSLFRRHIDECHSFLTSNGFPGVLPIILANTCENRWTASEEFEAFQAATFSVQYGLMHLWRSWGLSPCAVAGHSLGEYASLVAAEVLTFQDALTLIANRARLMINQCAFGVTGMVAVNLDSVIIQDMISSSDNFSGLSIACYNSDIDCTVSGPTEKLNLFVAHLDAEIHCKNVILAVPFGYHSCAMQPISEDLITIAGNITLQSPSLPIISNVLGDVIMPGDDTVFNAGYFSRQCVEPVKFKQGIISLVSRLSLAGTDVWIEIGPHTTILPMLRSNAQVPKSTLLIGSLRKQQDAWSTLAASLSELYVSNVSLLWRETFGHVQPVSCVDLPPYAFQKSKFWVNYKDETLENNSKGLLALSNAPHLFTEYSTHLTWMEYPTTLNRNVAIFGTSISNLARSIEGHRVVGFPLCPASVYIELVLAGIHLANRYLGQNFDSIDVVLRGIHFLNPLVCGKKHTCTVKTAITLHAGETGAFTVSTCIGSNESVHVRGEYQSKLTSQTAAKFFRILPFITRQMSAIDNPTDGETPQLFSTRAVYERIFPRVVEYAEEFRTIQSLTIDRAGMEGYAVIKLPLDHDVSVSVARPIFLDSLLHVAGFLANMQGGINDVHICNEIGTVKVIPELIDPADSYAVYCSNVWWADKGIMLGDSYAIRLSEPKRIVAQMKGIHFRRVHLSSLKCRLALAAQSYPDSSPENATHSAENRHLPFSESITACLTLPRSRILSPEGLSSIEVAVAEILSDTCHMDVTTLNRRSDLTSLGVDSLMSIEIFSKLQDAFPEANLDSHILISCRTIAEIVQEIDLRSSRKYCGTVAPDSDNIVTVNRIIRVETTSSPTGKSTEEVESSLIDIATALRLHTFTAQLQTSDICGRFPLFFVHDGSGLANCYERLFLPHRSIWAISNPHFLTAQPWHDLTQMATNYAYQIVNHASSTPVLLAGWSFGGVVAFETARQLFKLGISVKGVLLIDSPSPIDHVHLSEDLVDLIADMDRRCANADIKRLVKTQLTMNSHLLELYRPDANCAPYPPLVQLRSREPFVPDGVDNVPEWLADRSDPRKACAGWEKIVRVSVRYWDIPGNHFQPFQLSNLEEVSRCIAGACEYLEGL